LVSLSKKYKRGELEESKSQEEDELDGTHRTDQSEVAVV
jgi:hypothetical protein